MVTIYRWGNRPFVVWRAQYGVAGAVNGCRPTRNQRLEQTVDHRTMTVHIRGGEEIQRDRFECIKSHRIATPIWLIVYQKVKTRTMTTTCIRRMD